MNEVCIWFVVGCLMYVRLLLMMPFLSGASVAAEVSSLYLWGPQNIMKPHRAAAAANEGLIAHAADNHFNSLIMSP